MKSMPKACDPLQTSPINEVRSVSLIISPLLQSMSLTRSPLLQSMSLRSSPLLLQAKARIWRRLSFMCHTRQQACHEEYSKGLRSCLLKVSEPPRSLAIHEVLPSLA